MTLSRKPVRPDPTAGLAFPRRSPEPPPPAPIEARPAVAPARVVQVGPAELHAVPKARGRWVSRTYRAFVAQHPCASCGTTEQIEAHHHGAGGPSSRRGISQKVDDTRCVPLCWRCHVHLTVASRTAVGRLLGFPEWSAAEVDAYLYSLALELVTDFFTTGSEEQPAALTTAERVYAALLDLKDEEIAHVA